MSKFRKGIEDFPIREYDKTPYPILVMVIDLKNDDDVIAEYRLDYSKSEDRKQIGKLTYWAIRNHHSIETMALGDAENGC